MESMATEVKEWIKKAPVTTLLVVINVVVFGVLEIMGDTLDGDFMLRHGAMNPALVLYEGQWYRLLSSMFLHFGGEHLINNMFLLLVLGSFLETALGPVKYVAVYLGAGIVGSFVSFFHMMLIARNDISAGASGAIFGIIGGLVAIVLVHKGKYRDFTAKKMIIMVALTLYAGFRSDGVDNAAHMGGFLGGFLLTFILYGIPYLAGLLRERHFFKKN